MGHEIKFKPVTFYLGIADHLARVVEGQGQQEGPATSGETRTEAGVCGADQGPSSKSTGTTEEREERERVEMADSLRKGDPLGREGIEPAERSREEGHTGRQEH